MNDYYNKLYTGGIHDVDLEYGMQIAPRMSAKDIAQANLYEQTPELFEEEFFKGTFDGTDYNKKMAELATAAKIAGEENLYVKPEDVKKQIVLILTFQKKINLLVNVVQRIKSKST